ncbi:unnamed protein product [Rhizopus microsporus]
MSIDDHNGLIYLLLGDNDDIKAKKAHDYIERLTTLSLSELQQESAQLKEEQEKAKQNAQRLVFRNYPSFLDSQACTKQISSLLDELEAACNTFKQDSKSIKEEQHKISCI